MRLTRYTDYALRVLLYVGARPDRLCSIGEIAEAYDISRNHLMKVVHNLGRDGFLETVRGRTGGIRLARPATEIRVGEVIRRTEEGFELVDCNGCPILPVCGLPGVLNEALRAFIGVLDRYTLADVVKSRTDLRRLLGIDAAGAREPA
jgi:Rrf2 family nitric oxide-sensitive transcriptional repressor